MDIRELDRVGIAAFETAASNRIGFHIKEYFGWFKEISSQELCKILQLPRGIEICDNTLIWSGQIFQLQGQKYGYFIFGIYRYTGIDQTNRPAYCGTALGYAYEGFHLHPEKLYSMLTELVLSEGSIFNHEIKWPLIGFPMNDKSRVSSPAKGLQIFELVGDKKSAITDFFLYVFNLPEGSKIFAPTQKNALKYLDKSVSVVTQNNLDFRNKLQLENKYFFNSYENALEELINHQLNLNKTNQTSRLKENPNKKIYISKRKSQIDQSIPFKNGEKVGEAGMVKNRQLLILTSIMTFFIILVLGFVLLLNIGKNFSANIESKLSLIEKQVDSLSSKFDLLYAPLKFHSEFGDIILIPKSGKNSNPDIVSSLSIAYLDTHEVKVGDTMSVIAKNNEMELDRLRELNPGINYDQLSDGQTLTIERYDTIYKKD